MSDYDLINDYFDKSIFDIQYQILNILNFLINSAFNINQMSIQMVQKRKVREIQTTQQIIYKDDLYNQPQIKANLQEDIQIRSRRKYHNFDTNQGTTSYTQFQDNNQSRNQADQINNISIPQQAQKDQTIAIQSQNSFRVSVANRKQQFIPSTKKQFIIGYLFVIAGVFTDIQLLFELKIKNSIPIFTPAFLAFLFAIILSPFIQKYTSYEYGKRKTWIIISLITLFFIDLLLHHVELYDSFDFSIRALVVFTSSLVYSISLYPFALKQIRLPYKVAKLCIISLLIGKFLFFMICQLLEQYLYLRKLLIETLILFGIVLTHSQFTQSTLNSEKGLKYLSLVEISSYYRFFLNFKSKYMRLAVFLLLAQFGFNVLKEFELQTIIMGQLRKGFVTENEKILFQNPLHYLFIVLLLLIISLVIQFISTRNIVHIAGYLLLMLTICKLIITFTVVEYAGTDPETIMGYHQIMKYFLSFIVQFVDSLYDFTVVVLIFNLPISGVSAMVISFLIHIDSVGVIINFQMNKTIAYGIMTIQLVISVFIVKLFGWVNKGIVYLDQTIQEPQFVEKLVRTQFQVSEVQQGKFEQQRRY